MLLEKSQRSIAIMQGAHTTPWVVALSKPDPAEAKQTPVIRSWEVTAGSKYAGSVFFSPNASAVQILTTSIRDWKNEDS